MRDYREFAAQLRREIEQAALERTEPHPYRIESPAPRRAAARARWIAAAAALCVAMAAVAAGYRAWDGRKLVEEQNSLFVEEVLSRGLLQGGPVSAISLEAAGPLFEPSEPELPLDLGLPWAANQEPIPSS